MMTVEISAKSGVYAIRAQGHAGFADPGQDIVCSAASILIYTLAEMVFSEDFDESPTVDLSAGDALIQCKPTEENEARIRDAYDFVETGFAMLQQEYPGHICLVSGESR